MEGRIIGLNCGFYSVESDGVIYRVKARGAFRSSSIKPVVGDNVELDDGYLIINNVYPRSSYLKRPVIANLSQMLIVMSLVEPDFSYLLTFKYLTYANMNGIKAKIILTKSDKTVSEEKINEIYKALTDKDELFAALVESYQAPLNAMFDEPEDETKKVHWKKS